MIQLFSLELNMVVETLTIVLQIVIASNQNTIKYRDHICVGRDINGSMAFKMICLRLFMLVKWLIHPKIQLKRKMVVCVKEAYGTSQHHEDKLAIRVNQVPGLFVQLRVQHPQISPKEYVAIKSQILWNRSRYQGEIVDLKA